MDDLISRQKAIAEAERIIGERAGFKAYAIVDMLRKLDAEEPKITEKLEFLEFLFNVIQPNDMEQYLLMYNKKGEKIDERLNQQTGSD